MSFTPAQQPALRALLALAWERHATEEGIAGPVPRCVKRARCGACAYCRWYEQTLFAATGRTSTTECNAGRDYDRFMRELEIVAQAGIVWQMKCYEGDSTRLLHELRETFGQPALDAHRVTGDYLLATARQAFGPDLPGLWKLSREQCVMVLGEVKRWLRRRLKQEAPDAAVLPF